MYTAHVHSPCTQPMYTAHVHSPCTPHDAILHKMYVHGPCTHAARRENTCEKKVPQNFWVASRENSVMKGFAKCNILQIGSHRIHQVYSISNHALQSSTPIKDLGVLIDSKLKFNHHIVNFVNRARQRASLIFRGFLSRDTSHLVRAFTSYVRPLVEYASPVWSPSYIHLINEIESVQRTFTKRLPGLKQLTYADRLTLLNLKSLEHRRLIYDLILCFKIVRGFTSIDINEMFTLSRNPSSRGHSFRLEVPLAKCNTRNHFFCMSYRTCLECTSPSSSLIPKCSIFQKAGQ